MSLEHSPSRHAAYTIAEFCAAHRISRSKLYALWSEGKGPRTLDVGAKRIITMEAAADWRRERETASAKAQAGA